MKPTTKRLLDASLYVLGSLIIALGVVILMKTGLGMSTWDTLHYAVRATTPLSFGMAIVAVTLLLLLFIIAVRKDPKYLFMIIPFVLVGLFVEFFERIVFSGFDPEGMTGFWLFIYGLLSIPLGASFHVVSRFPAGVYDELMLVLMKLFKTRRLALVRILMEAAFVLFAVLLTGFFEGTIGALNFGTPLFVVLAGPLLRIYINLIGRIPIWKPTN